MTERKKRDLSLGLADCADRLGKLLAGSGLRIQAAKVEAEDKERAAIQRDVTKLVERVPADLRPKLVGVLLAMGVDAEGWTIAASVIDAEFDDVAEPAPPPDPEPREAPPPDPTPSGTTPYVPSAVARAARGLR